MGSQGRKGVISKAEAPRSLEICIRQEEAGVLGLRRKYKNVSILDLASDEHFSVE